MALLQTDNLWISQLAEGVAVLYLDVAGRNVNVLSRLVLDDLSKALDKVEAESSLNLLLIRSNKKNHFIAGADIHEFSEITTPEQAAAYSEKGQHLLNRLANLRVPVVAIISGACLGGGLELALACDYRIVVDNPRTQLGMPEIELGLLPAWGGTQRLPRVVGLEKGLQMLLTGRRLKASEAVKVGLGDYLVQEGEEGPPDFLGQPAKTPKSGLPFRSFRQRWLEGNPLGRWLIYKGTERILHQRLPEDMPAPWEVLASVKTGLHKGMEAGLAYEREAASRLTTSTACRNLIHLFLQREQARKLPERKPDEEPPIRRVGVAGVGVMGSSIAQLAALRGCEVVVQEEDDTALGMGILRILQLFNQAAQKGVIAPEELSKKMAAIHGSTSWKGFATLDLVIEAIIEDLEKKKKLFQEMEKQVSPSTILVSNTSSLTIKDLQKGLKHPGRVAGLHFFNPVHTMPLVELVATGATSPEVITNLKRFVVSLGKVPVQVKDSPGFVVNRVLVPYFNEAVLLVGEGMRIDWVDKAMLRFGMAMGPLEVLDQIGLDVASHVAESMKPVFEDRLSPHPGFERMKNKGWLGQKTGIGFYRWRGGKKKTNSEAQRLLAAETQKAGGRQVEPGSPGDEMKIASQRMIAVMVNEAVACLGEELAAEEAMIDLALVLGAGWAPHRGGPLRYARDRGCSLMLATLEELAKKYGPRFKPCSYWNRLISS